jgi:signal transduction histidine kinase
MAVSFPSRSRFVPEAAVRWIGKPIVRAVIVGLLTAVLGLALSYLPFGNDLEEGIGLDFLFNMRGQRKAPPEVVVIAIDKESARQMKLPLDPQKWPRSYHAELVDKLVHEGASVIAFDLYFDEGRSAEDDRAFAKSIGEAGNVVLLGYFKKEAIPIEGPTGRATGEITVERMVQPVPNLAQAAASVAAFPLPKVPLKVSQVWTFKDDSGDFPTMPVTVFQMFAMPEYGELIHLMKEALGDPKIPQAFRDGENGPPIAEARRLINLNRDDIAGAHGVHDLIRSLKNVLGHDSWVSGRMIGELDHPDGPSSKTGRAALLKGLINMYRKDNSRYLNFYGPAHTITTVPYYQALRLPNPVMVHGAAVDFKGKIVFIGSSEFSPYSQMDVYPTVFSQPNGMDLSGVEICATTVANLLEDRPVRPVGFPAHWMVLTGFALAAGLICILLRPMTAMVCSVGLIGVYVGLTYYQFKSGGVWFPVVIPVLFQVPLAFFVSVLWKFRDARKLEVAHEQLKEMDRLKSMFLSHVSHELKTPLTSIKGFVDNMMDGLTGEIRGKQRDYLDRMRVNADRLTRMITNLLDLSRIESGTHRLERVRLRLFDVAEEVMEQLRPIATAKKLNLEVVCPDPTVQVLADRDKFIQVITNLLDNAIKFTAPGGKITVAIGRKDAEHATLSVTDTGEGIPAEILIRLFEPFYQASRMPGAHAKGLGLGLSIVKTLVELHGGTVSVKSDVGKGSEFCIVIPAPKQGEE